MAITVESTTDSKEVVAQAQAPELKEESKVDEKSASAKEETQEQDETLEASDASEDSEDESKEADAEESEKEDEVRPKKINGVQKKINKLTKRVADERREKEYWKAEALKSSQVKPGEQQDQKKEVVKSDGRPKADDFESHQDYIEALTDWKLESREIEREVKAKENEAREEYKKQVGAFNERLNSFKESHEDFDDVIEDIDHIIIPQAIYDAIASSEIGPELIYDLAKNNRKDFERICKMNIPSAIREIGKVEARLSKETASSKEKPEEKKHSKAPTPIAPVGNKGGGSVRKSIYDQSLSQKDFERLREEQLKRA